MSDWGDEIEVEVGRAFGSSSSNYKTCDDGNNYNNGHNNENNNNGLSSSNDVEYGGRGRSLRGSGRGSGRFSGGGGGYRDKTDYDNEPQDSQDSEFTYNDHASEHFEYIPRDFKNRETVEQFMVKLPELWKTASLLGIHGIHHYLYMAFKYHLNVELAKNKKIKPRSKQSDEPHSIQKKPDIMSDDDEAEYMRNFIEFNLNDEKNENVHKIPGVDFKDTSNADLIPPSPSHIGNGISILLQQSVLELSQLPELPPLKSSFAKTKDIDLHKSDLQASSEDEHERSTTKTKIARMAPAASRRETAMSTGKKSEQPETPTIVQRRRIVDARIHLRERMPRQIFAKIVEERSPNYDEKTSAYMFFPCHCFSTIAPTQMSTMEGSDVGKIGTTSQSLLDNYSVSVNLARQNVTSENYRSHVSAFGPEIDFNLIFNETETVQFVNDFEMSSLMEHPGIGTPTVEPSISLWEPPIPRTAISTSLVEDGEKSLQTPVDVSVDTVGKSIEIPASTPLEEQVAISGGLLSTTGRPEISTTSVLQTDKTTLSTIPEESDFQKRVLRRTLRQSELSSTPLTRGTHLGITLDMETLKSQESSKTDDTNAMDSALMDSLGKGASIPLDKSGAATSNLRKGPNQEELQVVLPPVLEEEVVPGVPPIIQTSPQQVQIPPQSARDDGYRKDWYDILRERNIDLKYPSDMPIVKRRKKRKAPTLYEEEQALAINVTPFLPYLNTPPESPVPQLIAEAEAPVRSLAADARPHGVEIPSPQPGAVAISSPKVDINATEREAALKLLENTETIGDWHRILVEYRRCTIDPFFKYTPSVLQTAGAVERMKVRMAVLKEIIKSPSFDISKLPECQSRANVGIAFQFLLELRGAGIIRFGYDDGSERRNMGFGGGRGRGRIRGRGVFGGGVGGGDRHNGDRNGGGDYNNNKGDFDGGYGDEEQKKPREFYIPPEPTDNEDEIFNSGISSGLNFAKYDNIPVKVSGDNPPNPINSFEEANLRNLVLVNVQKSGYITPTPIQKTAIPIIADGRDLMGCAQTGSGKTAAFLLPIINNLLSMNSDLTVGKPQALIVSPTRELSIQIFHEARKFALGSYLKICILYGGTSSKHQGENVSKGCHILICTPGRLLDFVERAFITFEDTRFVVLDEADRMLDMGFKESINTIMNHPTMRAMEERQNLMFSATFPEEIQRLAGQFLNNYIFIAIGVVGGACTDVQQSIFEVKKFQKRSKLMEILHENPDGTIVFVETKRGADFLASLLSETEFPTTSIHGDRLQRQREMALADFKSGQMKVLIATSVAARGLDIKNIKHVVNYDMPKSIDDYVHRIGRTGRVGNNGRATSFFDPDQDSGIAADLVRILEGAGQEVPDFLRNYSSGGGGGGFSKFGGRDVRRDVKLDNNVITSSGPRALEEDEEWN